MKKTVASSRNDLFLKMDGIFQNYLALSLKIVKEVTIDGNQAARVFFKLDIDDCLIDLWESLYAINNNFKLAPDERGELPDLSKEYGSQEVFHQFRQVGIKLACDLLSKGRTLHEIKGVLAFHRHLCAQVMGTEDSKEFGDSIIKKGRGIATQLARPPFQKHCQKVVGYLKNDIFDIRTELKFDYLDGLRLDRVIAHSAVFQDQKDGKECWVPCSIFLRPIDDTFRRSAENEWFLKIKDLEEVTPSETCLVLHGIDSDFITQNVEEYIDLSLSDKTIQGNEPLGPIAERRFAELSQNPNWSQDEKLRCIADIGFLLCHDTFIARGGGEVPQMFVGALLEQHGLPKLPDQIVMWGEVMGCTSNSEFATVLKAILLPPGK